MEEVDNILAVEENNWCVFNCESSKKMYNMECKKMDNLLIKYHQTDDANLKNHFMVFLRIQKKLTVEAYDSMIRDIESYGCKVFDDSMIQKYKKMN